MTTVVISSHRVAASPAVGGHFWVYMQYARGLMALGCDVFWIERAPRSGDPNTDRRLVAIFLERMAAFGLRGKTALYGPDGAVRGNLSQADALGVLRRADLLLNFDYAIDPCLLSQVRRSALVDIDPGLLQFWIASGQVPLTPHDVHFTTGETVGAPSARFPDSGLRWIHVPPPVCLRSWPYVHDPDCETFTTVSSWWGGESKEGEWITDGDALLFENNKRVSFMRFLELPSSTNQPLELAVDFGEAGDSERELLERHGWRVRRAPEVAGSPALYRQYIRGSRGEFTCVKPSCIEFQNAWISDRTLCYLASGKPAVMQDTGPSSFLPSGDGLFRFSSVEDAVDALEQINADYEHHCRAAREIAQAHFDAERVVSKLLNAALA